MMLTDWDEIAELEEFKTDRDMMAALLEKSFGNTTLIDRDQAFIRIASHFCAIERYFTKKIVDQKDIDESSYFDLLRQEVGFKLPLTETFPISEFLRESKFWNAHRGTKILYEFIGDLLNSPIKVNIPRRLIFRTDNPATRLSGTVSEHGPLDWDQTKMGRLHDGVFWAAWTYVVDVLQAQNLLSFSDFQALIDNIHPAGTRRFLVFNWNIVDETFEDFGIEANELFFDVYRWCSIGYPTLDNDLRTDRIRHRLSMLGGDLGNVSIYVEPLDPEHKGTCYTTSQDDVLMHDYPEDKPWIVFNRQIANGDGTYTTVYADNDPLVYESQTTNAGLVDLTFGDIASRTMREIQHIAFDNSFKNPDLMFFEQMPLSTQEVSAEP